jgi:hypothetical protein
MSDVSDKILSEMGRHIGVQMKIQVTTWGVRLISSNALCGCSRSSHSGDGRISKNAQNGSQTCGSLAKNRGLLFTQPC